MISENLLITLLFILGISMQVNEIFTSIEGEGIRQGSLCSFVRFYGCRLHCSYCDTRYACTGGEFQEMTSGEIFRRLKEFQVTNVTLTGGEPLQQKDIASCVSLLLDQGFSINIETSGSRDYSEIWSREYREQYRDQLFLTVDYKCPNSGMEPMMKENCFLELQPQDVLKFVVSGGEDLQRMRQICDKYHTACHIFVSPVFGKIQPSDIVEYLQRYNLSDIRIQLQLHKYIWDPQRRGV